MFLCYSAEYQAFMHGCILKSYQLLSTLIMVNTYIC